MTVILFLLLSFSALAQGQYEYSLQGSFSSNVESQVTVNYSIFWNEAGTTLQGVYRDNYFSQGNPKVVSGTRTTDGPIFNVILPAEVSGVRMLSFSSSVPGPMSGNIPIRVVLSDDVGGTLETTDIFSQMSVLPAGLTDDLDEDDACTVGFGALTGYCGLYSGAFGEMGDTSNRCNLNSTGNLRLELGTDTIMRLHLNYLPGLPTATIHNIGAFPPSPVSPTLNLSGSTCGPLAGTTFEPNCKSLDLAGSFSQQGANIVFTGVYTIRDQVSGESCSYSLALRRDVAF